MQRALTKRAIFAALTVGAAGMAYRQSGDQPPIRRAVVELRAPASAPVFMDAPSPAPDPELSSLSATDLPLQLALAIERALVAADPAMRETAFNVLLPELLRRDPAAAAALLGDQPISPLRTEYREQLVRQWVMQDRAAAVYWMHGLPEVDRQAAALVATRAVAAHSPAKALELADEFGVGRADGIRDHLLQIWAVEDPGAVRQWLAAGGR